ADVDGLRERADRTRCLLAERRVRLVADHELVRLARKRILVAREPGVRLDRQRIAAQRLLAALDRRREAVAVTLGGQVTLELRDQEAAGGGGEGAHRARRFDEAGCGDRLPRSRRMAEPVAPNGAGIRAGPLRRSVPERILTAVLGGLFVFVDV